MEFIRKRVGFPFGFFTGHVLQDARDHGGTGGYGRGGGLSVDFAVHALRADVYCIYYIYTCIIITYTKIVSVSGRSGRVSVSVGRGETRPE